MPERKNPGDWVASRYIEEVADSSSPQFASSRRQVADSRAGMHVVGWLPGWSVTRTQSLVELAQQRGLGLHPIDPYYAKVPSRSGLLLGFAALSPAQLRAATRLLGECLETIMAAR